MFLVLLLPAPRIRWSPLSGPRCKGGTQTRKGWRSASSTHEARRNHAGSKSSLHMWVLHNLSHHIHTHTQTCWWESECVWCFFSVNSFSPPQFNYMHECFERVFCELKWRKEVPCFKNLRCLHSCRVWGCRVHVNKRCCVFRLKRKRRTKTIRTVVKMVCVVR